MLATLLSATLAVAPPGGPGLSEVESRIVAHIDAHAEEAVRLLERLVNINSGTMNHEGVRRVGEAIRPRLAAAGFETTWIDMPEQVDRAGHLFAFRRGERGRRVLLIGHLDTVFEADSPFQTFEREGERARGPGTEDMKGGDVVIVHALEALQAVGALDGTTVTVAFTGDEEDPGSPLSITRRDLVAA
ncbi:MAG TPA: M20/M25/M40 family metallo-hydrolase, partial [Vicinamibacteria bacterium]